MRDFIRHTVDALMVFVVVLFMVTLGSLCGRIIFETFTRSAQNTKIPHQIDSEYPAALQDCPQSILITKESGDVRVRLYWVTPTPSPTPAVGGVYLVPGVRIYPAPTPVPTPETFGWRFYEQSVPLPDYNDYLNPQLYDRISTGSMYLNTPDDTGA